MKKGTVAITLRLPAELHARLVKSAKELDRSLNSTIIWHLEDSFHAEVVIEGQSAEYRRLRKEFEEKVAPEQTRMAAAAREYEERLKELEGLADKAKHYVEFLEKMGVDVAAKAKQGGEAKD